MLRLLACALSLTVLGLTATAAHADEPPGPGQVRRPRPPSPDDVGKPVPAAPPEIVKTEPAAPEIAKVEPTPIAKVEPTPIAKVEPAPVKEPVAPPAKTTEAGGCRVDGSAGAWSLLALVGVGLRRRRIR